MSLAVATTTTPCWLEQGLIHSPHWLCELWGAYEMQEMWVQSLGGEDPLEEGMAAHSNILAWRIPMDREPGRLLSLGSQRVGHD